jgi:hypothetical protein
MPKFTIDWPNVNFAQDLKDFIRSNPNQTLGEGEENLSDGAWAKRKIILWLKGQVQKGAEKRLEEARQKVVAPDITIT